MTFTEESYYKEKFTDIKIGNEEIKEKEFENCNFVECGFLETHFRNCKFIDCIFSDCILSAVKLTNSHFLNITFKKSKVIGVDWTKTNRVEDLIFEGCQINYSVFRLLKLAKAKITNCEAEEVDFTEANFEGADFSNTNFKNSLFSKTNLSKASFKGAKNYYIDVYNNTIKKACFSMPEATSLLASLDITIQEV